MPITPAQLQMIGNHSIDLYLKNDPIDQIGKERPLVKALLGKKKPTSMGKEFIIENLRKDYQSNFQWYYGDAKVTYNKRDTLTQGKFTYGSAHDGFQLNEDEFLRAGIIVTDDNEAQATADEKVKIADLFKEQMEALKEGFEEKLDYEIHLDGSQHADAVAGLDQLISTDGVGTVGSIDATANPWWQNNFQTDVAGANMIEAMELQLKAITKHRGRVSKILMGPLAYDEYRLRAKAEVSRQVGLNASGQSAVLDAGITGLNFHGIPVECDWTMADVQADTASLINWEKRIYMIDERHFCYKPIRGHEMKSRTPKRNDDEYIWKFALTHKFAITTNKRRAHGVTVLA